MEREIREMSSMPDASVHVPVLLHEVIDALAPGPDKFVIDGTVNGGGHAAELIRHLTLGGAFLGLDWDKDVLSRTKLRLGAKNCRFLEGNYADLPELLQENHLEKADGLLLDLGFSSEQLAGSGKGFSFMGDEELRMTYDHEATPVKQLLRELREDDLGRIISEFGGERYARRIARAIKERLRRSPIETTKALHDVVISVLPRGYERGRIDPATRTFQALRIYANHELENLEKVLASLGEILKPGGRVAIITFHSLEDRIVKRAFITQAKENKLKLIHKKPIAPSREEILRNPRSRSAKLRVAEISS